MYSNKIADYFAKLILSTIMSFSFVYPLTTTLAFTYRPYEILGLSLSMLLVFSLLTLKANITKYSLFFTGIALLTVLVYLFFNDLLNYIYDPFIWLINYLNLIEPTNSDHYFFITMTICLPISLFVFIFTFKRFNFLIIAISGIILFSSQWILKYFVVETAYISFYTFCFSILAYYFIHVYYKKSKESSNDIVSFSNFLAWVFPVCIIIVIITNFIPVSSKPIQWKWMDNNIQILYNKFYLNFGLDGKFAGIDHMGKFSLSSLGFGDKNSLGGNIALDGTKVLEVKSVNRVYLRGRASDTYSDNSWSLSRIPFGTTHGLYLNANPYNNINDPNNLLRFDMYEMNFGFPFLTKKAYPDIIDYEDFTSALISNNLVEIKYQDIKTTSIFAPLKSMSFVFDDNNISRDDISVDLEGILSYTESLQKDFSYSIDNEVLNTQNEDLKNILRQSFYGFYNIEYEKVVDKICKHIIDNTYKELVEYFKNNYDLEEIQSSINSPTVTVDILEDPLDTELDISSSPPLLEDINFLSPNLLSPYSHSSLSTSMDDTTDLESWINTFFTTHYSATYITNSDFERHFTYYIQNYLYRKFIDYGYDERFFYRYARNACLELYSNNLFYNYYFLSILKNYSDYNLVRYTQLPDNMPQRVYDLANEIALDLDNTFDIASTIEEYLRKNYLYTLVPGDTPDGRDFVDYFLFDLKKGYCTYNASAMVILLRCLNIPARYVEGYVLPMNRSRDGLFEVTNREAHAWVEVYLEGVGWITFEPTSSYSRSSNPQSTPPPTPTSFQQPTGTRSPNSSSIDDIDNLQDNSRFINKEVMRIFLIVLASVLPIIMFVVFKKVLRKLRLKKLHKMNYRESIIKLFEMYLKLLNIQKRYIENGETPLEYADRIDKYGYFYPHKFKDITELFVKARYSQLDITQQEKDLVFQFYNHMLFVTRKKLGMLRYFFKIF